MLLAVLTALGQEDLLEIQVNAALHNGELTREELNEMAIFLTHYVGFPLGSKLDGAIKRVVAKRKKAAENGQRERQARTTSTPPSRCTSARPSMISRYAALSRDELATLVPELLLIGQLIDRSGMAWCISAFGREEMLQIAIEEWAASSPIYTRRMQKALNYEGVDVVTIFKGLQLDIGAPPQFMDFRYTVHDRWHGEFHLDHCGALMDVEPMGEDYVRGMCHDIEDPTFDATAVATNPQGPGAADPPPAADAGRPAPALRVDGHHRRVLPRRCRSSRRWTSSRRPAPPRSSSTRSTRPTKGSPTTRARCCPTSTSARSRTRRWSGSPTRCACRCTC